MEVIINGIKYVPELQLENPSKLQEALRSKITQGDHEGETIRFYLQSLLLTLWIEGEGFNSKRPFGNSGWDLGLIYSLVSSGFIEGAIDIDDDGYIEVSDYNDDEAYDFVSDLIKYLCSEK